MANFLSVLKKIGQGAIVASQFLPVYGQAARGITALIPGTKDDELLDRALQVGSDGLVAAQNIIISMEAAGQAAGVPGAQKAAMTAPALHQLFMTLPLLKGKKPKDAAAALKKAELVGAALADYFNEYEAE